MNYRFVAILKKKEKKKKKKKKRHFHPTGKRCLIEYRAHRSWSQQLSSLGHPFALGNYSGSLVDNLPRGNWTNRETKEGQDSLSAKLGKQMTERGTITEHKCFAFCLSSWEQFTLPSRVKGFPVSPMGTRHLTADPSSDAQTIGGVYWLAQQREPQWKTILCVCVCVCVCVRAPVYSRCPEGLCRFLLKLPLANKSLDQSSDAYLEQREKDWKVCCGVEPVCIAVKARELKAPSWECERWRKITSEHQSGHILAVRWRLQYRVKR